MANELVCKCVVFYKLKIKSLNMKSIRIFKSVIFIMIVGIVASCAASKDYSGKLFAPRTPSIKDSQEIALRFLILDKLEINNENMVSTDLIMGRDTGMNTVALDNFTNTFPLVDDTTNKSFIMKRTKYLSENKVISADSIAVAKSSNTGEIRNKRTRD